MIKISLNDDLSKSLDSLKKRSHDLVAVQSLVFVVMRLKMNF
jgi:hypothetical protein